MKPKAPVCRSNVTVARLPNAGWLGISIQTQKNVLARGKRGSLIEAKKVRTLLLDRRGCQKVAGIVSIQQSKNPRNLQNAMRKKAKKRGTT